MGTSESKFSKSQASDEITTVSERTQAVDPVLEKLKSLKIATPILKTPPSENSLTDILVRKPSSASSTGTLNPKILLELFSMYRDWQEEKAKRINKKQEELENKIDIADALVAKLMQRLNNSVSAMKTTAHHLSDVHPLQVEVGELKGRLREVISNCDLLCKRIDAEGPEALRSSMNSFSASDLQVAQCDSLQRIARNPST